VIYRGDKEPLDFLKFSLFIKKINYTGRTKLTINLGIRTSEAGITKVMLVLCAEINALHQSMIFTFSHRFNPENSTNQDIALLSFKRITEADNLPSPAKTPPLLFDTPSCHAGNNRAYYIGHMSDCQSNNHSYIRFGPRFIGPRINLDPSRRFLFVSLLPH
jgi:hypothetical protein